MKAGSNLFKIITFVLAVLTAGKLFTGWDKKFSNISTSKAATSRYSQTYTVTFKDYTGIVLSTVNVAEGEDAAAPANPSRDGYSFTGWSPSIQNVTKNITAVAQYQFNGGANVMDIVPTISGSTLTISVSIKGGVKFCGLEGNLVIPSGLTCKSAAADTGDTTVNVKDGKIYYMFSSSTGKNVTAETKLFTATFAIGNTTTASFSMNVDDIYDQDFVEVSYSVVGQSVKLK